MPDARRWSVGLSRGFLYSSMSVFLFCTFNIKVELFPTVPPLVQRETVLAPGSNDPKWPQLPPGNIQSLLQLFSFALTFAAGGRVRVEQGGVRQVFGCYAAA